MFGAIFEVDAQAVFTGAADGLMIGLLAVGFVLVYRSSRVINFAYGEVGTFGAVLLSLLVVQYHWNYWAALLVSVVAGVVLSLVIELAVVRRLFDAPRVVLFAATLGVSLLVRVMSMALPDIGLANARGGFPTPFFTPPSRKNPDASYSLLGWRLPFEIGDVKVQGRHVMAVLVAGVALAALAIFLGRTMYGLCIRASAANSDAARLAGVRPRRMSSIVWSIAGGMAVLTVVVAMPLRGLTPGPLIEATGPEILLLALTAALVGRMQSMPKAFVAGVAISVVNELVRFNVGADRLLLDTPGFIYIVVLAVALLAVLTQRDRGADGREGTFSFAPRAQPIPASIRHLFVVRQVARGVGIVAFGAAACLPLFLSVSRLDIVTAALATTLVGLSITLLTGWAGQLSLGQFSIAGIGALGTATIASRGVPTGAGRWFADGVPFVAAAVMATIACVAVAMIIGAPALRVRGLFLAVTTLAFAVLCDQWLYRRELFVPQGEQSVPVDRGRLGPIDLDSASSYYLLTLIVLALAVVVVARLRRGGIGRGLIAVRDNSATASAYTLSPTRSKLIAFGAAGALAGMGGALLAGSTRNANPINFAVTESLDVVAMTIVGGVGTIAGPIIGAFLVHALPAFFEFSDQVRLVTSGLGLLVILLYFPRGLVQVGVSVRDLWFARLARGRPLVAGPKSSAPPVRSVRSPATSAASPALRVEGVTVAFGGVHAVDDVTIDVGDGEVVGLIGANGAGKSTLMNAIGGYVPAQGEVRLFGHRVDGLAPHRRAASGLGRTFQNAELFQDLTVRETVQVALEARDATRLTGAVLGLPSHFRRERKRAAEADELISFLGLGRYADAFISNLSTGTRRICELACLLALDARLLCLDEPTAGVAQRETEAFGPLLVRVREELGASMLVIEHDMPLIMAISDRVYCLEAGRVIAEGTPNEVRNDAAVIASYLGTDERAIARSNTR